MFRWPRTPSQTDMTFLRLYYTKYGLWLHVLLHTTWADTKFHELHRKLNWVTTHVFLHNIWADAHVTNSIANWKVSLRLDYTTCGFFDLQNMTYKDKASYASLPPCSGTTYVATQKYAMAHVTNSMSRTPSQTELTFLRLDYTTHGLLLHMLLHNISADTTYHDLHRKHHWVSWDYSRQDMDLDNMCCHTTYALDTHTGWRRCIGCFKL